MEETSRQLGAPKAFISYSWSTPTHQTWVVNLATRLLEDGIDVILDKWDLKPGHDAYEFMEKMVTDESVTKVLMICDRIYAEKADGRSGGVGVESQIISPQIYASASQDKYAALTTEVGEDHRPFVPAFYGGRIYFDFTDEESFEREYESLLRWLWDKPLFVKPQLGTMPDHIEAPIPVASGTASRARRAEEAVKQGAPQAAAFVREYVDALVDELPRAADVREHAAWDETVLAAISAMRPYVLQFQSLVRTIARYSREPATFDEVLDCLERAGSLMFRPPQVSSWRETDFDHFKYTVMDMFLSLVAILLKERRFDLVQIAVEKPYLIKNRETSGQATSNYTIFRWSLGSLRVRNTRLGLSRAVPEADMLAEEYEHSNPTLEDIMQADLVLYLRSLKVGGGARRWFPLTLILATSRHNPFELFARGESEKFFAQIAPLLAVKGADEFKELVQSTHPEDKPLRFGMWDVPVLALANIDNLGAGS